MAGVENEVVNGTVMELGANVGSLGRSFSRLALAEDHSGTRYENTSSDLQILQENSQQNVQIQERQQNVPQNQLSARLNEQSISQNLQIQQLQQNIQQNQQSFEQNLQIQQRQQNVQPNQQSMEQNVQVQQLQLSIQQNQPSVKQSIHQNMQILHLQQNQQNLQSQQSQQSIQQIALQNMQIHQSALQQSLQHQAVAKTALPAPLQQHQQRSNGMVPHDSGELEAGSDKASRDLPNGFNRDMHELEDLLSKLNPLAEEFVPPSLANHVSAASLASVLMISNNNRRKKNNYNQGKRRVNSRISIAQREDSIRRTVYVSDVDQQVTEEQLAALFANCGQVVDCRVCGDPNSVLRFAFVEFTDEEGARAALSLAGTMLGYYPVRVLPSKTAIAPVNPTFLPRSEDEREMCARTIYCTNIDKKVSQADVKLFFESLCGEVSRLRLLGDYHHSTRIAFVEFVMAESAIAALNCSGAILGTLPIRVSPSKTPVRPRTSRPPLH